MKLTVIVEASRDRDFFGDERESLMEDVEEVLRFTYGFSGVVIAIEENGVTVTRDGYAVVKRPELLDKGVPERRPWA